MNISFLDAVQIEPEIGFTLFLDQSIGFEDSVEGNVDGAVIDDSDTVYTTHVMVSKSFKTDLFQDADLDLTYMLLNMNYDEHSENDFFFHVPSAELDWDYSGDQTISLKFGFEMAHLDSDDLYDGIVLTATTKKIMSRDSRLRLRYRFLDQQYDRPGDEGRDGGKHRFEARWRWLKDPSEMITTFTGRVEFKNADNDGYAYKGLEGRATLDLPLPDQKCELSFECGLRIRNYDDTYPGFAKDREDDRFELSGEISMPVYQDLISVSAELLYENNSSNISTFDFDNTAFEIHASLLFT